MTEAPVPEAYGELAALLKRAEDRLPPPPLQLTPVVWREEAVRILLENAKEDVRIERESYARRAISITWFWTTLFTALGAWALHQPLFVERLGVPRDLVPLIAVSANGLMWLFMIRFFWLWKRRRGPR